MNKKISDNKITAEWFIGRTRIDVASSTNNNSFIANIRMRSDSVLWVSISPGLGIEAARVLITKDSIKVMDKINKTLLLRDFNFFNNYLPYPIDFPILQNMLLGNLIFYNEKNITSDLQDSLYVLISEGENIRNTVFLNNNFQTVQSKIEDKNSPNQMTVRLNNYKNSEEKMFSFTRLIEILKGDKIVLSMEFDKAKINEPTDFPFTIKENYTEEKK